MAFTGTPAAEQAEKAILRRFASLIRSVGQYNRRKIAGSTFWSQHSWGNALDIMVGLGNYAAGDVIYAWLAKNKAALGIRSILWRVKDHHDHIHLELFPYGRYTPPLSSTGIGTFRYSSGKQVSNRIQLVPAEKVWTETIAEEKDVIAFNEKAGAEGVDVQHFLNSCGFKGADGLPLKLDGVCGTNTFHAYNQGLALIKRSANNQFISAWNIAHIAKAKGSGSGAVDATARSAAVAAQEDADTAHSRLDKLRTI